MSSATLNGPGETVSQHLPSLRDSGLTSHSTQRLPWIIHYHMYFFWCVILSDERSEESKEPYGRHQSPDLLL
jgi:hypothetical protein